jgi:hypothetical protein
MGQGTAYGALVATPTLGATVDVDLNAAGVRISRRQLRLDGNRQRYNGLGEESTDEALFNSTSASITRPVVIMTQ